MLINSGVSPKPKINIVKNTSSCAFLFFPTGRHAALNTKSLLHGRARIETLSEMKPNVSTG